MWPAENSATFRFWLQSRVKQSTRNSKDMITLWLRTQDLASDRTEFKSLMCHFLFLFVSVPLMCCFISHILSVPIYNDNNGRHTWFATPLWDSCTWSVRTYNTGFVARILSPKLRDLFPCRGNSLGYFFWPLSAPPWKGKVTESDCGVWKCAPAPSSLLSLRGRPIFQNYMSCSGLAIAFNIMEMFSIKEMFSAFSFGGKPTVLQNNVWLNR